MEASVEQAAPRGGPERAAPAIRLRELRRDYGDFPVLRGVTLELARGETLAVLGPNGAGKSTLLRILATLLRPTAGDAEVVGAALPRQAWKARGHLGYLGHEPLLYRELTVRENLQFNARLHAVADPGPRIASLLERAGLAARGDEYVRNLSAGMLQRAAICRALLHEPELLLLDEPRSHLDVGAADDVEVMLAPEPGRTRVLVTHEIERGLAESDRALVLGPAGEVAYASAAAALTEREARAMYGGRA